MIEPNNLRNRYRRMAAARISYGFSVPSLRLWVATASPDSYSTFPGARDEPVRLVRARRSVGKGRVVL